MPCSPRAPPRALLAGLVGAAVVATYPPLIEATGDLLSEPLGALWLTASLLALARRRYALAGVLLAAAVLTRANLLVLIPVLAVLLGRRGGVFALAALVPVVAWSINVGAPVSTGRRELAVRGDVPAGRRHVPGAKRELKGETIRFSPSCAVATRRTSRASGCSTRSRRAIRGLDRDAALRDAALRNLETYPREQPGRFAAMVAGKAPRLWLGPARGGTRSSTGACGSGTSCS